ncbi:hypothetical protein GN330_05050 [Nitratireductor sp. CAU 1489]|uniref:Lipoprotein n=1 Tax=Nitratireductor arenosus TaxID=2682096 RepID=A0A844QBJ5_9HYPH|nr:hypothetical protein [Nitratireductor arenosus]MVA96615.1 hypothetical protein [Nitratireductor arenosus]
MSIFSRIPVFVLVVLLAGSVARAEDEEVQRYSFQDGELTITRQDYERVAAYDGRELHRDYFVAFDRIVTVRDVEIALLSAGNGGNACGPYTIMLWKPENGDVKTEIVGEECGAPPPAVTDEYIYFVPYLRPGEQAVIRSWAPDSGFETTGVLSYAPQQDTDWSNFDPATVSHPIELFRNAGLYDAALALLGDELFSVAAGLGTSSEPEITDDGVLTARGCVPHACGAQDTFVVVDVENRTLYFAQQQAGPAPRFWPERDEWPAAIAGLVPDDL